MVLICAAAYCLLLMGSQFLATIRIRILNAFINSSKQFLHHSPPQKKVMECTKKLNLK